MENFLKCAEYKKLKALYEKNYFKICGEYAYYDGNKLSVKSASHIAEYFKNKKVIVDVKKYDEEGEVTGTIKKTKNFYQIWSEDPKMKEYREVVFDCNLTDVKDYQFNLFDGFEIKNHIIKNKKNAADGVKYINDHISILCNHNPDGIKTTKYFYAQALQQPHILPNFCLVFISKEGVGKDMFSEFIEKIFGEKYCYNVDKLDLVVGRFNSLLGGKLIGVINETDPIDSQQRRDNIKFVVTAKKVTIEGKHKDPVKAPNYCRQTFYANRLTAFPAESGSRRPYIQNCSQEKLPKVIGAQQSKEYFDKLGEYINDRDVQKAFYDELMKFDIAKFNFKDQEKSELQKTLEDCAKPPLSEFLCELVSKAVVEDIKIKTVELLGKYTEFTKKRNMKFDMSQKAFNLEIEHEYKVKKYISCGVAKFSINVKSTKELLMNEYKYTFNDNEEDNDEDKDDDYENGVDKTDLSVNQKNFTNLELMNHYKKLYDEYAQKWFEELNSKDLKPKKIQKNVDKTEAKEVNVEWCDKVIVENKIQHKPFEISLDEKGVSDFCNDFFE